MGTVNVLEAVRRAGSQVRAVLVVTSDKCYENAGDSSEALSRERPARGGGSLLELQGLRGAA